MQWSFDVLDKSSHFLAARILSLNWNKFHPQRLRARSLCAPSRYCNAGAKRHEHTSRCEYDIATALASPGADGPRSTGQAWVSLSGHTVGLFLYSESDAPPALLVRSPATRYAQGYGAANGCGRLRRTSTAEQGTDSRGVLSSSILSKLPASRRPVGAARGRPAHLPIGAS